MEEPIYIDRPPRIQPELPFDEVEIPSPPDKEEDGYTQLIQVALPLITIIGYVLIATLGGTGRSPWLLIPMALSVVASTAFSIYSYRKEQQQRAEAEQAYSDRLVEMNKEMHNHHDMQRRFYRYNYPDRSTTFRIVHNARREVEKAERTLRSESRLWERRVSDEDFGAVRLGMGTLPSTVRYVLGEVENFEDPQVREAMKLEEDSQFVSEIPVIISLRDARDEEEEEEREDEEDATRTPITHALGIAGQDESVYAFTRSLLAHYVVFHAPMDARLFVLASHRDKWAWAESLPHAQKDDQTEYLCFLDQIEDEDQEFIFGKDQGGALEQYLEGIRKVLAQRKIRLADRDDDESKGNPTTPLLLVVVDLLDATYDEESPLDDLESDAAISILVEEGGRLGAAVVFLVPERSKVPSSCQSVIEIEKTTPATNSHSQKFQRLHFRYAEIGVNSFRYVGEADYVSRAEHMATLAQKLANMDVRKGFGANLTKTVPFLDLMEQPSLDALLTQTAENWEMSSDPQYANWLSVKLGRMSGNKARTLVFSAKQDGVHGMVAGSTGSGKSELLISLITGMAVVYDPTVLNFVLVDYKGGGAFKGFEDLPHCVDIITNLEGEGVTRMFTAIQSEMQRRQALNSETGTKNIVEYRQRGLHLTHHPYPFLFIIIDEFAEMIADRSEFKSELESITRVGRAQGVSLILAAQRPTGVTDQMRSNIKFRICLRVETPAESREMLRRNDAAYLPSGIPGRGYLQIGNEEIELVQLAYTGDKYIDPNQSPRAGVIWPDRGDSYDASEDQEPPELYKAIVDSLDELSDELDIEKQRAPWPDFLPPHLSLSELLASKDPKAKEAITSTEYLGNIDKITLGRSPDAILTLNPSMNKWLNGENGWVEDLDWGEYAMRPVVGLIDNPFAAKQLPLAIDMPRGHVAIFGASGWGKTTFIRTLIVSLTATHSPNHLHVYVLDLGGRNLGVLDELPHVGAVIIPDKEGYEERVEQLLRELEGFIEERKEILNNASVPDVYRYNDLNPDKTLPAVLVAIDNFIEFKETFDNETDNVESVLDKFVGLARQAKPYGIHFVISVNRLNVLSNQLYSVFTERLTLKLADPAEYRPIIGGQVSDVGDIPGRGYIKFGHQPLSFQVAQPIDLRREGVEEQANENRELKQYAQSMKDYLATATRPYQEPVRVEALPKSVLFKQMLSRELGLKLDETFLEGLKAEARRQWRLNLEPEHADWLKAMLGVISGNRTRTLEFEAKKDGVHGLIAGGTGSGKSELLMTLIVALVLNYDPSVLNFVLVDYKGGGAFKPFDDLPHVVDSITNLNRSAVKRMFTAIKAEMQRRQRLNADTSTKDIVEYREKGYHLSHAPYPHLFIIIDEYAEMITDNPEFKDELDSITRVGRAQGVNLLLASQRPTGVSDQMRANIKFRICLRVEGVTTSREMLRRSDAAFLPSGMPGRGYLQIGNENIELMQVAYTGETYPYAETMEGGKEPKFYDVVVQLAQELLAELGRERPHTPWPPFLPTQLTLSDVPVEEYLEDRYESLITLGHYDRLTGLNPFLDDWFRGKVGWHGVHWRNTAMRGIIGLVDDPYNARQLPLTVDLTKGHVVLFGASGWGKTTFMRTLIVSLAATHSPDEFQAHVLDLGGRNLEVLQELPHVGTIVMPDERGYEERVQQLLRELNDIVDERKRLFSESGVSTLYEYNNSPDHPIKPAILVVIDNFTEFMETFGEGVKVAGGDSLLEAFILLVRQAKAYGVHFVISVDRLNVLSSKLYSLFTERLTLRLSDSTHYRAIVGGKISDIDEIQGRGYVKIGRQPLEFQVAIAVGEFDEQGQLQREAQQIRELGRIMHRLGREQQAWSGQAPLQIDALPKTSSYRQVMAEELAISQEKAFLDELEAAMARRWATTRAAEEADWLEVVLGITSGNRKRALHFSAKTDGVHGMIAGGTGSGKSELLMTMIVGLAANYDPSILNFVLVDYKGGGAFQPFRELPHVVDIVTNLNKAGVDRMFAAINAEMRRRQAMNTETGTKDIIDYRKRGLHLNGGEPYPHLFIIIDEYAEMIDDNPEYKAELESITRVGRAQGVNLILASQRPKGVSDQMRANIKLRICLRVEQTDTSRELLRRPDAAHLPNGLPGRGYIQVGSENLELIQVSWTGEKQPDERETAVLWPDRPQAEAVQAGEDAPKLYDVVAQISSNLYGGGMAPKPWPGFLPTQFSLQSPIWDGQKNESFTLTTAVTDWLNGDTEDLWPGVDWQENALRPVVGLVDDPREARQEPLTFTLSRSHLAVFGDSGWGKTSFMRTIAVHLAGSHAPDECHLYILDLGGRNYRSLEDLPHVGAVVYADEEAYEERLNRLLDKLNRMTEERQQLFSNADAATLYEYNSRHPEEALPAVVVMIDNFADLRENYEMLVESTIIPLVRRSLSVGISFVVSGNVPNNMPSKLYNLFGERITFKQANPDRYMDIVGRGAIEFDDIPGRGYIRVGRRPLLFHAALPVGVFDDEGRDPRSEADEIRLMGRHMNAHLQKREREWTYRPDPIKILPELVPLRGMLEAAGEPRRHRIQAVAGQNDRLLPALFDLRRTAPHFAVVGPPLSGKTTALYNWTLSLAHRYSPDEAMLVLVDLQRRFIEYGGERQLDELPHVLMSITEAEQIETLYNHLKVECEALINQDTERELFIIIDNFDDFTEEIDRNRNLARDLSTNIASLARRYGRDGLHFVIAGMLDGGVSELRRRVLAANYGIGLRTAQSLDKLRVTRRPGGLRGKELPVGRGYIVRSGQATMVQVATPYEGMGVPIGSATDLADEEEMQAEVLDKWVAEIRERYPEQQATWSDVTAAPDGDGEDGAVVVDSETRPAINLLRRILYKQGDEKETVALWDDGDVLLNFIKEALQEETGLDPDLIYGTKEEIMHAAEAHFPEITGNGADESEEAEEEPQAAD